MMRTDNSHEGKLSGITALPLLWKQRPAPSCSKLSDLHATAVALAANGAEKVARYNLIQMEKINAIPHTIGRFPRICPESE